MTQASPDTTITCNSCGITLIPNEWGYLPDHLHIVKRWGYGTSLDNQVHTWTLCVPCYQAVVVSLSIPPVIENGL